MNDTTLARSGVWIHKAGLKMNATMLYGHIESVEDRLDHFIQSIGAHHAR